MIFLFSSVRTALFGLIVIVPMILVSLAPRMANGTHEVLAAPSGGIFNSVQNVTLSSTPGAAIFYTADGSEPNVNSTQYNGTAIIISSNTTLKIIAVDPSDNHTSTIVTEIYIIDTTPPFVEETEPTDGKRRVDIRSTINATFSESVNETTVTTDTFVVTSEFGYSISGVVTYNASSNTASFIPDSPLNFGEVYIATLTDGIKDDAGNSLENISWRFTTGGQIIITLNDVQESSQSIPGSAFTITPNPFTLEGSLFVEDNGTYDFDLVDFGSSVDGAIVIDNAENNFTTYIISETTVPNGYSRLYGDSLVTVVQANACEFCFSTALLAIQNLNSSVSITDVESNISVPPPYLNRTQFTLYENKVIVGIFSGVQGGIFPTFGTILGPANTGMPAAQIVTAATLDTLLPTESLNLETATSNALTGEQIIDEFDIPTYPGPAQSIAADVIYSVPAVVIPYEGSENNFVLTPVIDKVYPGLTLLLNQSSFVESQLARVREINMTFNVEGTYIGFSFGISDTRPPETPPPQLDVPALFLDVGFVGDVDFSDPNAFQSSPKIDILVNKTLPGFPELPNGCPDFKLLFFDGTDWTEVQKLEPTGNFTDFCPFTLEPEHFSKFGVGGVIGDVIATEGRHHGGGGSGGSTSVQQMISGTDVESKTSVGSDSVSISFDTVEPGSGQLKISTADISKFIDVFDEMVSEGGKEKGMVALDGSTFSTAGKVFDIDASAVKFQGMVNVTIPYDEQIAQSSGSESNVRLLHYNEQEERWEDTTVAFDAEKNTVTGMMDSLSPVIAAIVNDGTYGSTYFEKNPLSRIIITNDHSNVSENESTGERLSIPLTIRNLQRADQQYSVLIQILDEENIARYISWQEGSLARAQSTDISFTWQSVQEGHFKVQIFVWNNLDHSSALSQISVLEIAARH